MRGAAIAAALLLGGAAAPAIAATAQPSIALESQKSVLVVTGKHFPAGTDVIAQASSAAGATNSPPTRVANDGTFSSVVPLAPQMSGKVSVTARAYGGLVTGVSNLDEGKAGGESLKVGTTSGDKACAADDNCTGEDKDRDGIYDMVKASTPAGNANTSAKTQQPAVPASTGTTATTGTPSSLIPPWATGRTATATPASTLPAGKPAATATKTTTVPAATTQAPNGRASTGSTATTGLNTPLLKKRASQITSTFENSTTEIQYAYAEDIGDERGITAGRAGFTSGTSDLLELVENYTAAVPDNVLAKYLPALRAVNGSASTEGLEGFEQDFATAAKDPQFIAEQDALVDKLYFNPAIAIAEENGVKTALGQAIFWDTIILHGEGGSDGLAAVASETNAQMGGAANGNEAQWIETFLDVRLQHLLNWSESGAMDDESSTSRIDGLRELVAAGAWDLNPPFSWTAYGESFTVSE